MKVKNLKEGYLYKDYGKRGWCRNGTFEVIIDKDNGKVRIKDTYWSDEWFFATDEYVKDFEEVLKLEDYKLCKWNKAKDYDESDVIQVHYNQSSGRFPEYMDYFVRKDAEESKEKLIEQLEETIKNQKDYLESNERQLQELIDGERKPSQVFIWQ